jgi:hypothetical protein
MIGQRRQRDKNGIYISINYIIICLLESTAETDSAV